MSMPSSMAAHIPMDEPCGECEYCASPNWVLESHPTIFKAVSNSHVNGINFRSSHFTANQIADAFANLIPGHMDWTIKISALERWNTRKAKDWMGASGNEHPRTKDAYLHVKAFHREAPNDSEPAMRVDA